MAEREADLLPLPYYHVVFTLPSAIGAIAWQNKALIYGLLFKAASETMLTIAADPKHLGARIGMTAVLHTWGSALTHHPHVHMIVPGGGLSPDGERFVPCRGRRRRFFLPVRVLSRLFRRLMLDKLSQAYDKGHLTLRGSLVKLAAPGVFAAQLKPLRWKKWFVYIKEPFAGPKAVLSPSRSPICRATPTGWRSRTGGSSPATNAASPSAIARLRELLGAAPSAEASASPGQGQPAETVLPPCPRCGGRMTMIEFFERGMLPRYRPPIFRTGLGAIRKARVPLTHAAAVPLESP